MSASVAQYLKLISGRRTLYQLKPELPSGVTLQEIQKYIQTIIKDTPTAFNSQVNRAVILTGQTHKKVWDHVVEGIPVEAGKKRPASVRDEAYGSIIFFTDDVTTKKFQADFARWASAFPQFADHTSGAAQIHSWTLLEGLGLGAHLQHYNPLVKEALGDSVPAEWQVHSQLCFGTPIEGPGEKTFIENEVNILN